MTARIPIRRPVERMLAFYGADPDDLDRIRASGLPVDDGPYAMSTSLEKARARWPDRALLAIDLLRTRSGTGGPTGERSDGPVGGREEGVGNGPRGEEEAAGQEPYEGRTPGENGGLPGLAWKLPAVAPGAVLNLDPYRPPEPVAAAGGYLLRTGPRGVELVVIRRRGVWDLPKGTIEPGEEPAETAEREVREEVGLSELTVLDALGHTVHAYYRDDRFRVKKTAWFAMTARGGALRPEREEGIEEVEWMPLGDAAERLGYRTLSAHLDRWESTARRALIRGGD